MVVVRAWSKAQSSTHNCVCMYALPGTSPGSMPLPGSGSMPLPGIMCMRYQGVFNAVTRRYLLALLKSIFMRTGKYVYALPESIYMPLSGSI